MLNANISNKMTHGELAAFSMNMFSSYTDTHSCYSLLIFVHSLSSQN